MKRHWLLSLFVCCFSLLYSSAQEKPNIIYILADDLGYGDLSVYNKKSKIKTPHLDQLAKQGVRFTDAHSPSSVCTPTRYSILTGRYPFRSKLPVGVLQGYSRPLIETDRMTVAKLLQENGYNTAVIGKWHLGLGWKPKREYAHLLNVPGYGIQTEMRPEHIDFDAELELSPNTHGFDYSYVLPASLDMPPYVYVENKKLVERLTSTTPGQKPDTAYGGAFWRGGLQSKSFDFYGVLPHFTAKAKTFIEQQSNRNPFFLYLPFPSPHTPWMPTEEYRGKSEAGEYGDFVQQMDAAVGSILQTLDSMGLSKNTIVIFTSDNGPYWREDHIKQFNHRAAGDWKGMKGDAYEAGHRVPFIVRWPEKMKGNQTNPALISHVNFMATVSDLLQVNSPKYKTEDSYSMLPLWLGQSSAVEGQDAVVQSSSMGYFAVRSGDWKLIMGLGSGGFSYPKQYAAASGEAPGQLYNLRKDPEEKENVYGINPEVVDRLKKRLQEIRAK